MVYFGFSFSVIPIGLIFPLCLLFDQNTTQCEIVLYRVEFLLLKEEVSPIFKEGLFPNSVVWETALIPVLVGGTDSWY